MGIKFDAKNPVNMGIASTLGMTSWANAGFATDPKHLILAAVTSLTGLASPTNMTNKPNVSAESHIITPYVNNLEGDQE